MLHLPSNGWSTPLPERLRALLTMTAENVPQVFPPEALAQLRESVAVAPDTAVADFDAPRIRDILARTEILVTGWGCGRRQRGPGRRVHPRHDPAGGQGRLRRPGAAAGRGRLPRQGARAGHRQPRPPGASWSTRAPRAVLIRTTPSGVRAGSRRPIMCCAPGASRRSSTSPTPSRCPPARPSAPPERLRHPAPRRLPRQRGRAPGPRGRRGGGTVGARRVVGVRGGSGGAAAGGVRPATDQGPGDPCARPAVPPNTSLSGHIAHHGGTRPGRRAGKGIP